MTMRLWTVPLELDEANRIVEILHRHHTPKSKHRFSIGALDSAGVVHGAAICDRPAARALSARDVLEVSRLCTDGTPNACSVLYAAAARAAAALGYRRAQTYILDTESGVSLLAAGWRHDGNTPAAGLGWDSRPGRRQPAHLAGVKGRWVRDLATTRPDLVAFPDAVEILEPQALFDTPTGT